MSELKTPDEWSAEFGVTIHDPDGWRMAGAPKWTTLLSFKEFGWRMAISTTEIIDKDSYNKMMTRFREG